MGFIGPQNNVVDSILLTLDTGKLRDFLNALMNC
jgi:hypothetical protein